MRPKRCPPRAKTASLADRPRTTPASSDADPATETSPRDHTCFGQGGHWLGLDRYASRSKVSVALGHQFYWCRPPMSTAHSPSSRNFSQSQRINTRLWNSAGRRSGRAESSTCLARTLLRAGCTGSRRGPVTQTVRFRTPAWKRRLTHFALIWYLIGSDFKQRAKLPKRRSSILPVQPSPGTRHATRSARRVRTPRDSESGIDRLKPA